MSFAPARSDTSRPLNRTRALVWRYGTSVIGPAFVSASHFFAALVFLHTLPPADFGAFSFLLVIVPFCMSVVSALVGVPVANALAGFGQINPAKLATYRKLTLLLASGALLLVTLLMRVSEGHWTIALMLGLYGGAMTLRWCARAFALAADRALNPMLADLLYSVLLVPGLLLLMLAGRLFPAAAAVVLVIAAWGSLLAYGRRYAREQREAWKTGKLSLYPHTWRNLSRWSLMGVVLTEATANAHAYFVTFMSGTASFALLAAGGLMMRPLALVLSALADRERPAIARFIAAGDRRNVHRTMVEFSLAGIAMWFFTLLLAGAIFVWFPHLLLEKGYDAAHLLPVVVIWSLIWAVRTLWAPQTALLQAAGEYCGLAQISLWSSLVALSVTPILLLIGGPQLSLLGVLAGDLVNLWCVHVLVRAWKKRHA